MNEDLRDENAEGRVEPVSKKLKLSVDETAQDASNSVQLKPSTAQQEAAVGIKMYLNEHEKFTGMLKHRYSDFLVNEIDLQKNIVHLSSFEPPEESTDEEKVEVSKTFSKDVLEELEKLSQGISSSDVHIPVTNEDKASRTKIHQCIRQNFNNMKSCTQKIGEENFIVVQYCKQGNPARGKWPSSRPSFTHFVLYKENIDTMDATRTIAKCLNMNPNAFTYAGTKDKRAKTCQNVSVYRVEATKLLRLNTFLRNIKIGNVKYQKETLNLGDLYGNRFTIILRNLSKTGCVVDETLQHFAKNGFINYFGLQRFGTTSIPTHNIGRNLILEDYERAVQLILEPRGSSESPDMQECRRIWCETQDAQQALKVLHKKNSIEGILLKGISTHNKRDFLNAFNKIPRNTRLLYLHSYQSYIWNCIVSLRISEMGLEPVKGDLYIVKSERKDTDNTEAEVVTEEVLKAGTISMYDVVLPLPGHSILYPENQVHSWYKELLQKDGLNFQSFRTRVKENSLSGCYRHILVKPENVIWEQVKYDDPNEALCASDYEKLQKDFHCSNQGETSALKLEFSLPSSAYATMAVREIMKTE